MNDIPQKCKETLAEYYGERLQGVILYGSTARKEATAASDLDLLVLLRPPFDFFQELWQITDLLYPVQLESFQLIAALPAGIDEFERGSIQLYRNAMKEGISV